MNVRSIALGIAVLTAVAGCGIGPTATEPPIHLTIVSPLTVRLVVNGAAVADVAGTRTFGLADLPPMPWTVELTTTSGRILATLAADAAGVTATVEPNGNSSYSSFFRRVDLSCGMLALWVSRIDPPSYGPAPGSPAGTVGDCGP